MELSTQGVLGSESALEHTLLSSRFQFVSFSPNSFEPEQPDATPMEISFQLSIEFGSRCYSGDRHRTRPKFGAPPGRGIVRRISTMGRGNCLRIHPSTIHAVDPRVHTLPSMVDLHGELQFPWRRRRLHNYYVFNFSNGGNILVLRWL